MASTAASQSWIWSTEHNDYYQRVVDSGGQHPFFWASQNAVTQTGGPARPYVILHEIKQYEHVNVLGRGHGAG